MLANRLPRLYQRKNVLTIFNEMTQFMVDLLQAPNRRRFQPRKLMGTLPQQTGVNALTF